MKTKKILLLITIILSVFQVFCQTGNNIDQPGFNWYHMDMDLDKIPGISTARAYNELLKDKKATDIIVAIIDMGVDINHEDLKDQIWTNENEIPGNGIDDDNNGYVDDIHGWNFLGNLDGENVEFDNWEIVRDYKKLKEKFDKTDTLRLSQTEETEFKNYKDIKSQIWKERALVDQKLQAWKGFYSGFLNAKMQISEYIDSGEINLEILDKIDVPKNDTITLKAFNYLLRSLEAGYDDTKIKLIIKTFENRLLYELNADYDPREIIGDNPNDFDDKKYGNPDIIGPDPHHGTEIAGVIGAKRLNKAFVDGITNNVKIMVLRAVPSGDERDKDIINAIYYAVDNGAKIINMSFGKPLNHNEAYMDKALKYAEKNGVLIIRGATNLGQDSDIYPMHPDKYYADGSECQLMINVGATTRYADSTLIWNLSNYGKNSVDIMAPGSEIYTLFPGNKTIFTQGTSISSPMVVGVAALVWSYFPELTALNVKNILLESAEDFGDQEVIMPGSSNKKVMFKDLSRTGGIVNAYNAILLAERKLIK